MFSTILALGTILLQIFIVVLVVGWIANASFVAQVARQAHLLLGFIFVGSIIGSLIYEYGFGYAPCLLCWYQRIFIFGIAILLFTADIRKNRLLQRQIVIFASIGLLIALFHNYIDIFPTGIDVCGATGPSCLARYVYEFGYITIPMMSATALLAGLLLAAIAKRYPHESLAPIIQ